ncbi:MAG: LysM peptidoglycan-binding domain-containing protein [Parcubacteria group bacterium]|jgi:surface antigen
MRTVLKGENIRLASSRLYSLQISSTSYLKRKFVGRKILALFREHSATIVVAICVALVALINLSSTKGARGSLFDSLKSGPQNKDSLKNKVTLQNGRKNNLATAPLAGPGYLSDTDVSAEEDLYPSGDYEMTIPTAQSQILLASYNPQTSGMGRREMKTYEVKDGDTAGSIAAKNGVSVNTILWANSLSETSLIKPGDKIAILPVTGVKYKVQKGDSLETIVNKYNSDKQKVLAYNELPADEKIKEGQELILPDGYVSAPSAPLTQTTRLASTIPTSTSQVQYASISSNSKDVKAGAGHRFPYGYCTWYVAQKKYVPWGGNAGAWLTNARAFGKATGRTPKPGAIVVTGESRWGHVAVVESVSGSSFTVSEMNYRGFAKKSTRTISTKSGIVRGFIY